MTQSLNSSLSAYGDNPLAEILDAPVRVGLVTQGHIPAIEPMLLAGKDWHQIGFAIGWDAAVVAQHYAVYAVKRIRELEAPWTGGCAESGLPTRAEREREPPSVLIDVSSPQHPDSPFAAIVFSTCYENPVDAYLSLEKILARQGVEGEVLFDLLAANGSDAPDCRYVCCRLKGGHFEREWGHPRAPEELGYDYRAYCDEFYRNHCRKVDLSLLSQALRIRFESAAGH